MARLSKEKPIKTERPSYGGGTEIISNHPAFGLIGAYRQSGGAPNLFGSPIAHAAGCVKIEIMTAHESNDRYSIRQVDDKKIVSVTLSEAQWAAFVSTMNVGCGVPCTINLRQVGPLEKMPEIDVETESERQKAMIQERVRKDMAKLREAYEDLNALVKAKGTPTKAQLNEVLTKLLQAVGHAPSNYEFAGKLVEEHFDRVSTATKAELSAYVTRVAMQFPALAGANDQQTIEDKSNDVL